MGILDYLPTFEVVPAPYLRQLRAQTKSASASLQGWFPTNEVPNDIAFLEIPHHNESPVRAWLSLLFPPEHHRQFDRDCYAHLDSLFEGYRPA
jgi:hypothetical protein